MLNPIIEMRRLSNKSFEELKRVAVAICGLLPDAKCSKVELITYIVAQECMHDNLAEKIAHPEKNTKRTRFILDDEGNTYHVMLTKEQIDFMDWCFKKSIDFSCAGVEEIKDVSWEMP